LVLLGTFYLLVLFINCVDAKALEALKMFYELYECQFNSKQKKKHIFVNE